MDEEDDLFDDDDSELISILEKAELEYRNSQLRSTSNNYTNTANTTYTNTNANTTSILHEDSHQQQQQSNGSQADHGSPTANVTDNWFSTIRPIEYGGIDVEKQKLELKSALRHVAQLQSELTFRNQELESSKAELRKTKDKLQEQESKKSNAPMDIDPQSPGPTASFSMQSTQDPGHNNQSAPRRTLFPSIRPHPVKRPRTSASPSPGPSSSRSSQRTQIPIQPFAPPQTPPPPPPMKNEGEIKKQREAEQAAFKKAVDLSVANQLGLLKQDIEQQRKTKKAHDCQAFLRCLGTVNFVKSHAGVSDLQTIILNDLRPPQLMTESDSILNALSNDISQCISQVRPIGVTATISKILFILRIFIQLCVQEEKIIMFIRATELIYTLSTHYQSQIITHLTQEMLGAGDQSTLHFLARGLALIPLKNVDEGNGKGAYIQGFTDTTNLDYRKIRALLKGYSFGDSDTRRLLTSVTPSQAQETVSMILQLLSGLGTLGISDNEMELKKNSGSTKRLLFLLDQKGFTDLISPRKPLVTTDEALFLVYALVADGNTDWLYVEKYRPLLKDIYSCLTVPRPQGRLELKWYSIRQMAIRLFNKIMALVPIPLSPETAFSLALSSSIYVLNNECLRIEEDSHRPPFESVPNPESDRLLIDTVSLMLKTLDIYPILLDYQEDDVYFQILTALKRFEQVMEKSSADLRYQCRAMLSRLSDVLKQKSILMVPEAS